MEGRGVEGEKRTVKTTAEREWERSTSDKTAAAVEKSLRRSRVQIQCEFTLNESVEKKKNSFGATSPEHALSPAIPLTSTIHRALSSSCGDHSGGVCHVPRLFNAPVCEGLKCPGVRPV